MVPFEVTSVRLALFSLACRTVAPPAGIVMANNVGWLVVCQELTYLYPCLCTYSIGI